MERRPFSRRYSVMESDPRHDARIIGIHNNGMSSDPDLREGNRHSIEIMIENELRAQLPTIVSTITSTLEAHLSQGPYAVRFLLPVLHEAC